MPPSRTDSDEGRKVSLCPLPLPETSMEKSRLSAFVFRASVTV